MIDNSTMQYVDPPRETRAPYVDPKTESYCKKRKEDKQLRGKYREAAKRLLSDDTSTAHEAIVYSASVGQDAHVQPMNDGAFVEVVVWVPREEAEKEVE